jgi:hypothetical protein
MEFLLSDLSLQTTNKLNPNDVVVQSKHPQVQSKTLSSEMINQRNHLHYQLFPEYYEKQETTTNQESSVLDSHRSKSGVVNPTRKFQESASKASKDALDSLAQSNKFDYTNSTVKSAAFKSPLSYVIQADLDALLHSPPVVLNNTFLSSSSAATPLAPPTVVHTHVYVVSTYLFCNHSNKH